MTTRAAPCRANPHGIDHGAKLGTWSTFRAGQPGFVPGPGGAQGTLCLGGAIGRYLGVGQVLNSGAQCTFTLALDLTRTPSPNSLAAVLSGETRQFQAWNRDMNPPATRK